VRPALLAAFRRARRLGLGVEAVEKALSTALETPQGDAAGLSRAPKRPAAPKATT
jgi:hypothetical protein